MVRYLPHSQSDITAPMKGVAYTAVTNQATFSFA